MVRGSCSEAAKSLSLKTRLPLTATQGSSSHLPMDLSHAEEAIADSFEDFLPLMEEKLGEVGLMQELEKGFRLLSDPSSQTITFLSLKQNGPLIGLPSMSDEELLEMLNLGGGPELDFRGFCVAVIRTSPAFMQKAMEIILKDTFSASDQCETGA